jgi:phosphoribosylformylglycinamidine synthase
MGKTVIRRYCSPGLEAGQLQRLVVKSHSLGIPVAHITTEYCFNVETTDTLDSKEMGLLEWCLNEGGCKLQDTPFLSGSPGEFFIEVGPRMNFSTAWNTNCVSVLKAADITKVPRVERSRRYCVTSTEPLTDEQKAKFTSIIHDRMTEMVYETPLTSFETGITCKPVRWIPVLAKGKEALKAISDEDGLGFDDWDLQYYCDLYQNDLKRDPSDVELFDFAQSNSEHSRHWFFGGIMVIDGETKKDTLFRLVKDTLDKNPNANKNSTIAFSDNSSAIVGPRIKSLVPAYATDKTKKAGFPCEYVDAEIDMDLLFTAETHNMPTGICPFAGAETGTGGRLRDVQATGIGAHYVAGTIGYCVGSLNMPGHKLPYEDPSWVYPETMASPLDILIEGSNGASDYGNKFGEPLINGYTRSFGIRTSGGERREWIKPILFTGGFGQMDARHRKKAEPGIGMKVVKVGGPAYRIGVGGGAASSNSSGENRADLDFNAVQRGDAEMEQKMNRVIRACVDLGDRNPIVSLHDQGCGGNCNVLKEIIEPIGGKIEIRDIICGDETMSVLEIWGAEYQENNCCLVKPEDVEALITISERERSGICVVGEVTGDGNCIVHDARDDTIPVNLPLDKILGKMPQKTFTSNISDIPLPTDEPEIFTALLSRTGEAVIGDALTRVLSSVTVGSKRFLTNKVDRSVGGLIAQQQCVGPLMTPLSDCAVIAQSHVTPDGEKVTGGATAIGEQPIKGLLSPQANARMSVAEAVTNIVWAKCTALGDIKCEGNWMWACKLPGEGSMMYKCAEALKEVMLELGLAIDGGKDSLSMCAKAGGEMVKCPGEITVTAYCTCPDVTLTVTPDLKSPAGASILLVQIAGDKARCGGSVFAHVYQKLGVDPADCEVEIAQKLKAAFNVTQDLIEKRKISAGHDRSDGGLAGAVLEMAFAGNCGVTLDVSKVAGATTLQALFHEEVGLVIEVSGANCDEVMKAYAAAGVECIKIGAPSAKDEVVITGKSGAVEFTDKMTVLRDSWESTSFALEKLQANPECIVQEEAGMKKRKTPLLHATIPNPQPTWSVSPSATRVAIIREEGSNGDKEMAAAFRLAGMQPWDVTMSDLAAGRISLSQFRGCAFVGGFSYADVLGSAKGWAATALFQETASAELRKFYGRKDTFSLGVCNGCQLAHRLEWVPFGPGAVPEEEKPRLAHNKSARFESRWVNLRVEKSQSIFTKGMEGSILGIWSAHGEGQFEFPNPAHKTKVEQNGQVAFRYVDDDGVATEEYPFNPNGSQSGIASLCSGDGRHLAIMPHPERSVLKWQMPYMPTSMSPEGPQAAPWLQLFINARLWAEANP